MIEEFSDGTRVVVQSKDEFLEIVHEFFVQDYLEEANICNLHQFFATEEFDIPDKSVINPIEAFSNDEDLDIDKIDDLLGEVFTEEKEEGKKQMPIDISKIKIKDNGQLELTELELNAISVVARERKFLINKTEMLYSKTYTSKIVTFLNNFRFLTSVYNAILHDTIVSLKIKTFLKHYEKLNDELLKLNSIMSNKDYFGGSRYKRQATKLVFENDSKINLFIDSLYSIGKVVSQYSPDTAVGML